MIKTYEEALKTLNDIRDYLHIARADDCVEQLDKVAKYLIEEYHKTHETIKPNKTTKHSWCKDESGDIDVFGYSEGFCNGPKCEICNWTFCHHCNPRGYEDEDCNEHYICKCGQHLKGTEKRCPNCDNLLDWSDN